MSDLLKDNGHTGLTSKFHYFRPLTSTYVLSLLETGRIRERERERVSSHVPRGCAVLKHLLTILALSSVVTCELSLHVHAHVCVCVCTERASDPRCFQMLPSGIYGPCQQLENLIYGPQMIRWWHLPKREGRHSIEMRCRAKREEREIKARTGQK